jgi:jouberin
MKAEESHKLFENEEDKTNKIEIKITKSGPLSMDKFILHPFVRVHIVDLKTYKYLAKQDPRTPGVFNQEHASYYNSYKTHFECPTIDYYLPLTTTHYDLRPKAENFCSWYQSFVVDVNAEHFLRPEVVLLFEILDYSPALILDNSKRLNADNFLPIAWGYLRPIGQARQHLAESKIQLYYYKGSHTKKRSYKAEIDPRTPDVLCELNWPNKSKYPSYLEISLNFFKPEPPKIITHFSRFPWEKEVGLREFKKKHFKRRAIKFGKKPIQDAEKEERMKYFKWERTRHEPCKRPDTFLRKLETEAMGAFRLKFSNNGDFLAAA